MPFTPTHLLSVSRLFGKDANETPCFHIFRIQNRDKYYKNFIRQKMVSTKYDYHYLYRNTATRNLNTTLCLIPAGGPMPV